MRLQELLWKIPYGTKDLLPQEAAGKRAIEERLAAMFRRWGYDEVITPTMEFLDTFTKGDNEKRESGLFKFFDRSNQILALRSDMTTPIARVAASRLKDAPTPLKLSYIDNVFRYEQAQAGRQCEFYQAGVELLGIPDASADAEVIAIAVEALLEAGLPNFRISLGQVEFVNGIMEASGLSDDEVDRVKAAMIHHDLVALDAVLDATALTDDMKELIRQIPILHGGEELLNEVYQKVKNAKSRAALSNLAEIYRLLACYGVEKYIHFDLGIIRDLDYYTGMVFEGYAPGLGFPICGGGRYDQMLKSFGTDCPATGFSVGIERIMLSLERQGLAADLRKKDVYIGWKHGKMPEAIQEANRLRAEGLCVELGLTPQTKEQAMQCQQDKGYARFVYIEG